MALVGLVLWPLAASPAAADDAVVPAKIATGDVWVTSTPSKTGDGAPTFEAHALIDAPPAVVWSVVSRCADYRRHMPRIAESAELKRDGNSVTCRVTADMPFPIPDLTSVSQAVHTADVAAGNYQRAWTLVEGDYDVNEGAWILKSTGAGKQTYAIYRLRVKPKLPVPAGLAALFQKGPLVDAMLALRKESVKRAAATGGK